MSTNPCLEPGCTSMGVFPGTRSDGDAPVVGHWCFEHDPTTTTVTADQPAEPAPYTPDDSFHVDVVAGLASMLLEHTAMTYVDGENATTEAMRSLSDNTGWTLDVAAGVLMACTAITAAGEVSPEQLTDLAAIYEDQANTEDEAEPEAPAGNECAVCAGTGQVTVPMSGKKKKSEPCDACKGTGRIIDPAEIDEMNDDDPNWAQKIGQLVASRKDQVGPDDERDRMASEVPCEACNGTGAVEYADPDEMSDYCVACEGRGVIDIAGPEPTLLVDVDEPEISSTAVVEEQATMETSDD